MKNGKLMVAPAMLWLSIFFVIPLLIVVAVSFAGRTPYGQIIFEFTLKNYLRFLEPLYLQIFADTLIVAVITTVATIIMGYPLAYFIARLPKKWQQPGLILVMIPFWINFLIRSYAWVIILRTQGVVNTFLMKLGLIEQPLQMLYNDAAVMLGMIYALLPFMVLPIYVSIEQLDLRLLEAASDLGASPMTAFRKITLPLTMPGIAAGTILVFISSLGMFVVPDVMGGAKSALIGNLIQNQFLAARDWPFGSALSIVLAVMSLVLIILTTRLCSRRKEGLKMQKTWRSHLLLAYSLVILAFLYLPLLILALYSFNESRINAVWTGFTLDWYASLFQNRRVLEALMNSLFIAVISTVVSTVLGTIAAIALNRYQYKCKPVINGLLYLPILIPEIVMGLSLLVLFAQTQVPLGKVTLILAHITFCLSFVVITVNARLEGMRHELEQAAMDLYATPFQTFRYVTLPLAMPGIIAGALIAFTLSIDDFIISFFVAGPNSTTLPLYIYAMVKRGISPEINALSTLLMFATISLIVIAQILQPQHSSKNKD